MKRDAEETWAAERVENALLRRRINDVAAEVARLTATLEGPGSAIVSMLADVPALGQGAAGAGTRPRHGRRQRRTEPGCGSRTEQQDHARRPHPRAAVDRVPRCVVELTSLTLRRGIPRKSRPDGRDPEKRTPVFRKNRAEMTGRLAQR